MKFHEFIISGKLEKIEEITLTQLDYLIEEFDDKYIYGGRLDADDESGTYMIFYDGDKPRFCVNSSRFIEIVDDLILEVVSVTFYNNKATVDLVDLDTLNRYYYDGIEYTDDQARLLQRYVRNVSLLRCRLISGHRVDIIGEYKRENNN